MLEDGLVERILGRPNVNLFRRKRPLLRGVLFPGFFKPLPTAIQERVLSRAASEGIADPGEALFLIVRYSPEVRADEKLLARLDTTTPRTSKDTGNRRSCRNAGGSGPHLSRHLSRERVSLRHPERDLLVDVRRGAGAFRFSHTSRVFLKSEFL